MNKFIGVILLLFSTLAYSEGFKSENELRQFSESLIDQMVSEKFQAGFDSAMNRVKLDTHKLKIKYH